MPLTEQMPPEDPSALTAAIEDLSRGRFSRLILTSGNTVRALVACGWDGTVPEQTQVGVVGPGTARVLEELTSLRNPWVPQEHSASGILAQLPRPTSGENPRLLLPQSAQARSQLAAGLSEQGWEVTHIAAYQTVALGPEQAVRSSRSLHLGSGSEAGAAEAVLTPEELVAGDAVLVTSSTAAEQWAARRPQTRVKLLAIGQPTAETLARLGTLADQVLSAPTAPAALSCLEA